MINMSNQEEKILLPPRYHHYQRDEWNLLYDPDNVVWTRVNNDGLKILETLKKEGTIEGVCLFFASEFPNESIDNIKKIVEPYIRNMVKTGFLHAGTYRDKKPKPFYMDAPENIYLSMSYQCTLKCRYCYNFNDRSNFNHINSNQKQPEMSIKEYRQLLEEARSLGVKRILFTGGEPLLNPLSLPVGRFAKELGFTTELITNGMLIDQDNVQDIAATFDCISVSLDSINKETHEYLRGKGCFDKVIAAIRLLKAGGGKVRINSVITKFNVGQMLETWRGAVEELKCDFYTNTLYSPTSNDEALKNEFLPDIDELIREQERAQAYFKSYPAVAASGTKLRFSCGIANGEIGISYDGIVYPCHLLHKPELECGNLHEKRLGQILEESPLIAQLRKFNIDDIPQCQPCDFKYLCGGGCMAMTYNLYGNFTQTKNFYCQFLIHDHIERMWSGTVTEIKSIPTLTAE